MTTHSPNLMAPTPTPALVQIFVRSPEDDFTRFIIGKLAIIAIIIFIPIFGLCICGAAYWCRERRRTTRYRAMADHYRKGGLPLTEAGIAPVELTSLSVPPPPPAYTPTKAIRTDYGLASTVPYSEPSRPSAQGKLNPVTGLGHNDLDLTTPARTYYGYYSPAAVRSTPTPPPPRVPSYYAYAPSSSIVPLLVDAGSSGKGWEYIVPPAGSPPPPDIGRQ